MRAYNNYEIQKMLPIVQMEIDNQFPFEVARDGQKELILQIVTTFMEGKKFFILEAPTGTGKSVIGTTAAKVINALFTNPDDEKDKGNACVCTKTKALQNQYSESFPDIVSLWSASGYECNVAPFNPDAHYGSYTCNKKFCKAYESCNYRVERDKFNKSPMGVLNFAYFLHNRNYYPKIVS